MAENTRQRPRVSTTSAALLLGGAGLIVAGAGAYLSGILDPWLGRPPAAVTEDAAPEAVKPSSAVAPQRTEQPVQAAEEAAERDDRLPAFELLRVEPDGSTVIAGRAGAEAAVEVLAGETLIATAKAGAGGDFAIVLDEPLKPGDYEITLRATDPAGAVSRSSSTAIISVPETPDGQVLALVERPGQASEIMVAPEPGKTAELNVPAETAPEVAAAAPADAAATAEEKPAEVAATDPAATAPAEGVEPAASGPASGPLVAVEAVEIEGPKVFVAGAADPGYTVRVYANDIHLGDAKSSTQGRFLIEATRNLPVGDYIIRADVLGPAAEVLSRAAVPFEREPGDSIAAVAPGVASAVPGGEDAAPAIAAAVNEAAPDVATTAPAPAAATTQPAEAAGTATASPEPSSVEQAAVAGASAPELPAAAETSPDIASNEARAPAQAAEVADGAASTSTPPDVQPRADEQAAVSAAETPPAPGDEAAALAATQARESSAKVTGESAPATAASEPAMSATAAGTPAATGTTAERASAPASPTVAVTEAATPVETQIATAAAEPDVTQPAEVAAAEPVQAATPPAQVATAEPGMTQPKLQSVTRSVIIRKGDSLWKISRRAYGQGIRYSTLYLANRDQIQDPSKIWVGQVFTVPALAE